MIRHHLLLPETATRRDLDDPATVGSVAATLADPRLVGLLAGLVEADSRATGPGVWNSWKAGLVRELALRVRSVLAGDQLPPPPPLSANQQLLVDAGELAVHVEAGPHAALVTVVSPDRPGLLAIVAGVLALHKLEVRSATAQTMGVTALNVWTTVPAHGDLPEPARVTEDLRRALDGRLDVAARLAARDAGRASRPRGDAPDPLPPRVEVVPDASRSATVLEVRAHDAPGLLYRVALAISRSGHNVRTAKVATLGAEVVDVFYLTGDDGGPLDRDAAARVHEAVVGVLA
jgi:[protein-PII] uridylyltransferase